ncbi:MAG: phosphotransferase, partial [Deltaproteobacteria bacterium]|nr:phosphotransferase [Deltaproteobacteria bacterium]
MKTEEDTLWGSFSLDQRIEVSAMAEVFLVHRGDDERPYILKRPTIERRDDPTAAALFAHEQYLTTQADHPNLVKSVDSGEIKGWPYLLLEHRPGVSLVRILAAAVQAGRRLSGVTVIHIALQMARALKALHATCDADGAFLSTIHMDIAPHNVLVSMNDGRVTLLDLGIARSRRLSREVAAVHGRSAYLAPEQIVLTDPLDARVDIF